MKAEWGRRRKGREDKERKEKWKTSTEAKIPSTELVSQFSFVTIWGEIQKMLRNLFFQKSLDPDLDDIQ